MSKQQPFKYGRRVCIFCEKQPPEVQISKEHLFADWLRQYIPREMTEHRTRTALVHTNEPDKVSIQKRTGDPHSRRLRCVCTTCNEGWMSRLQEQAKPFLVPLITGVDTPLHRRAQRTLAAWIAMTIMVAENIDRTLVAVDQKDRAWLHANQTAPSHWRIWISAHRRDQHYLYTHNLLTLTEKKIEAVSNDPALVPNTQTTTICLGDYLLIHAMSSSVAPSFIGRWPLPGPVRSVIHQIWPIRNGTVRWSRAKRLTDDGIRLLANHFFDASGLYVSSLSRSSGGSP